MTECWSEGQLRAYLDRELPPEERERIAAHLGECVECARVAAELDGRAAWVAEMMDTLAVAERAPRRARTHWRWVAAAAALAAGIAIGALIRQRPVEPRVAVAPEPVKAQPAVPLVSEPAAAPQAASVKRPALRRPARRPVPPDNGFVALDDEPFDTGVVLRMALGPAEIPADVLVGPDGRAHAIRLVNYR